jgi:molybdenum cofactor synthesis domain-containing protein
MRIVHSACALLIGNELLNGKVRDENLHALATTLRGLGIPLTRALVLRDDPGELARELQHQMAQHDLIVTSGGVGPTHDDVTLSAVAEAFGVKCSVSTEMIQHLQRIYANRLTDGHLRMANIPEGAQLVVSPDVAWPTIVKGNVWMFPGVPELFRAKLASLRQHLRGPSEFHTRSVFTQLDEGELTALLDQLVSLHPEVEVGSYPKWFDPSYKTKITLDGLSEPAVETALQRLLDGLPPGEPQRVE